MITVLTDFHLSCSSVTCHRCLSCRKLFPVAVFLLWTPQQSRRQVLLRPLLSRIYCQVSHAGVVAEVDMLLDIFNTGQDDLKLQGERTSLSVRGNYSARSDEPSASPVPFTRQDAPGTSQAIILEETIPLSTNMTPHQDASTFLSSATSSSSDNIAMVDLSLSPEGGMELEMHPLAPSSPHLHVQKTLERSGKSFIPALNILSWLFLPFASPHSLLPFAFILSASICSFWWKFWPRNPQKCLIQARGIHKLYSYCRTLLYLLYSESDE